MSESQGRRFSTTYGMAAPYTPMLASLRLLFETFQQLFFAFSTPKPSYIHQNLLCFPLSYCTGTHHMELSECMVCTSYVFASPFPHCRTRRCVVCSLSYRSQHSVPFFICAWQLYPSLLLCWLATYNEKHVRRTSNNQSGQVKYT